MRITELGKRYGLSRSTLLYYERIGLLRASGRSAAGYRRYSAGDEERLARICTYRRAGLPLREIGRILDAPKGRLTGALQQRLEELDDEMGALRRQQVVLAKLLGNSDSRVSSKGMDKATWVALLAASGFSEQDMRRWHAAFERSAPDKHQRFLRFLGIDAKEAATIRRRSRARR